MQPYIKFRYIRGVEMLDNNKCILVYGLSNIELENIKELGAKFEIFNNNIIDEKVILYNNLSEEELRKAIKDTRTKIKDGILAVVTPQSINWKINYLIKHLKEEKEWYSKVRKER